MLKQRFITVGATIGVLLLIIVVIVIAVLASGANRDGTDTAQEVSLPSRLDRDLCPSEYGSRPLVLVSLDGFRPDYLKRGHNPTLVTLGERGVSAPYMVPSYPTITFPNHYTIVTGLYPESHGIINNKFRDPEFGANFSLGSDTIKEGRWWGGDPIWNTLRKYDKKSATFFWPGSEAEIDGHQPTHWFPYNSKVPFGERVDQVLEWLSLPSEDRPAFVSLYFNEPDHAGHKYGPDSEELNEQLVRVEKQMVKLVQGLIDRQLVHCVNMIVLADHGMAAAGEGNKIELTNYVPRMYEVADVYSGPIGRINLKEEDYDMRLEIMRNLSCRRPDMRVYSPEDLPKRYHFSNNRRIADIMVTLDAGKTVTVNSSWFIEGQHGYDNNFEEMRALFLAYGPDFKQGLEVEPFQNIELYNLMCHLTGVTPSVNNGTWGSMHHLLAQPPSNPQVQQEVQPQTASFPTGDLQDHLTMSKCKDDSAIPQEWLSSLQFDPAQELEIESYHLPWGIPYSSHLPLSVKLHHTDHVTGFSERFRMPLWTSFTVKGTPPGTDAVPWRSDIRLDPTTAPTCPNFGVLSTQGFIMKPLFPPFFSRNATLPEIPFLVSNAVAMTPSLGEHWRGLLQELVPRWLEDHGPLNILVGPIFDSDDDSLADDVSKIRSPVAPTDYFAVITRCKKDVKSLDSCPTGEVDALSFIFPQALSVTNCLETARFAKEFSGRVKDIELVTGLTLFHSLPFADRLKVLLRINADLWSTA